MREAKIISGVDLSEIRPLPLDDFSRFKEKMIMIEAFKSLVSETDKAIFKTIVRDSGAKMTTKSLRQALETVVEQAIKRVAT